MRASLGEAVNRCVTAKGKTYEMHKEKPCLCHSRVGGDLLNRTPKAQTIEEIVDGFVLKM